MYNVVKWNDSRAMVMLRTCCSRREMRGEEGREVPGQGSQGNRWETGNWGRDRGKAAAASFRLRVANAHRSIMESSSPSGVHWNYGNLIPPSSGRRSLIASGRPIRVFVAVPNSIRPFSAQQSWRMRAHFTPIRLRARCPSTAAAGGAGCRTNGRGSRWWLLLLPPSLSVLVLPLVLSLLLPLTVPPHTQRSPPGAVCF